MIIPAFAGGRPEQVDVAAGRGAVDAGACAIVQKAACECVKNADCAKFEDGDLCNGTLYCNKANGKCELNPATVVTCTGVYDTQCAKNVCDPATFDTLSLMS